MLKACMGFIVRAAIYSGLRSAIDFGTSSPITTERKVIAKTTIATAIESAYLPIKDHLESHRARSCEKVVPLIVPVSMPISVIATWIVER